MSPPPPSMACCSRLPSLAVLFSLLLPAGATTTSGARPATTFAPAPALAAATWGALLEQRLDGEGSQQCWEALMEIKSCTGEIILLFLNGEAYLGPGCCRAIRIIEQSCWAADAMLSVIGFTPEEGNMLKGYCDAGEDDGGQQQQHQGSPQPPAAPRRAGVEVVAREAVAAPVAGRKESVHR